MKLRLNGRDVDFSGSCVRELIEQFAPRAALVVEKNGVIVPKESHGSETLSDGDVVELVRLVEEAEAVEKGLYAVLDANLNRALEGIRVCEDLMRFWGRRSDLSLRLKEARHGIAAASKRFPRELLLSGRDVDEDAQRFVDLPLEKDRKSAADVISANIHRAQEAVRVLEETGKLFPDGPDGGNPFQEIRFSLYALEKEILLAFLADDRRARFSSTLYAILDSEFIAPGSFVETARRLIVSGAGVLQLRMKRASSGEFLACAQAVAQVCREGGALFIVNDRPDIAYLSGADGVHLGQEDMPVAEARRVLRGDMIVGKSTHSADQARAALAGGADYIAIGPVFGTASKQEEPLPGIGLEAVREVCGLSPVPVVAIGGITPERVMELRSAGCSCAAVISYLYRDGAIETNVRSMVGELRRD